MRQAKVRKLTDDAFFVADPLMYRGGIVEYDERIANQTISAYWNETVVDSDATPDPDTPSQPRFPLG